MVAAVAVAAAVFGGALDLGAAQATLDCATLSAGPCKESAECFWNVSADKCGKFVLPCTQYQTPSACKAAPGCRKSPEMHCIPTERPAPESPPKDTSCLGQAKRKCKRNPSCNWNQSARRAFGRAAGCMDHMPNACQGFQTKKSCKAAPLCKREKVFHCVSRKQVTPGCDCESNPSACPECTTL